MRVIECDCGHTLQAATDAELVEQVREHVEQEHPDRNLGEEDVRNLVEQRAYDATDS